MTKEVQAYIKFWEKKKVLLEREIAIKKRSLEQALEKLSEPEFHLNKELKRGAVKVSKALGIEVNKKPKTVLKKKSESIEPIEIPTAEMDFSGGASGQADPVAPIGEKEPIEEKSSWSFFK